MPNNTAVKFDSEQGEYFGEECALVKRHYPEVHSHLFASIRREHLKELETEIERVEDLLRSQAEVEHQGTPVSRATFDRAIAFLKKESSQLWVRTGVTLPAPTMGLGPDGSIDLFWSSENVELLINVPADSEELATYYGTDNRQQTIKGYLNLSTYSPMVAAWIRA